MQFFWGNAFLCGIDWPITYYVAQVTLSFILLKYLILVYYFHSINISLFLLQHLILFHKFFFFICFKMYCPSFSLCNGATSVGGYTIVELNFAWLQFKKFVKLPFGGNVQNSHCLSPSVSQSFSLSSYLFIGNIASMRYLRNEKIAMR